MTNQSLILPGQQAPYSQEAEEAVIGAVLVNPEAFITVSAFLTAEDFYILRHQYLWEAMQRIGERNEPIDYLTIQEELRAMGRLNDIGGPAYITQLTTTVPTSVHAEIYGRLVERAAIRRRMLIAADEIKALALDEDLAIEQVTTDAESRLFKVTERNVRRDVVNLREALGDYFDRIEHLMQYPNETIGLPTGFRDIDTLLGGLQRSDLLIFAGRPGMGKTSFLLSVTSNAAKLGGRIAIFSMEMGADQLVQRLISMETGINSQKLRLGQLNQRDWNLFVQAVKRMDAFRIFIDDSPALTPLQLRTKCRRLVHEHGLDLVVVDYLQLMNGGGNFDNNRVQEISYISRSLKELARELNVPIFTAAQLSRAVEQRHDKRPQLSDLRESGCLTGDSLIFLPDENRTLPIRELTGRSGFNVLALNPVTWKLESSPVSNAFCTGVKPVYKMTTRLGRSIRATCNHKFLTICGWKRLDELTTDDYIAVPRVLPSAPIQTMTYLNSKNIRRERAGRLADIVQSAPIENLATSDVYWDGIASIEADGTAEVYDLTVPGLSNFVSNNIIAHNSIEQDADIVMFLYRDVVYNEATEFPNRADILISKHRNGPTGTVSLHFENSLTKFTDAKTQTIDLGSL
ncbi:MAG: replicative DNA helicase [Anaerolineae bacterium]|nr:replicative DNA helicase [Anaerolineae bacterium]